MYQGGLEIYVNTIFFWYDAPQLIRINWALILFTCVVLSCFFLIYDALCPVQPKKTFCLGNKGPKSLSTFFLPPKVYDNLDIIINHKFPFFYFTPYIHISFFYKYYQNSCVYEQKRFVASLLKFMIFMMR